MKPVARHGRHPSSPVPALMNRARRPESASTTLPGTPGSGGRMDAGRTVSRRGRRVGNHRQGEDAAPADPLRGRDLRHRRGAATTTRTGTRGAREKPVGQRDNALHHALLHQRARRIAAPPRSPSCPPCSASQVRRVRPRPGRTGRVIRRSPPGTLAQTAFTLGTRNERRSGSPRRRYKHGSLHTSPVTPAGRTVCSESPRSHRSAAF